MKTFTILKLFILVLVLLEVNGKRYSSGSSRSTSSRGSSGSRGSGWNPFKSKPKPQPTKPKPQTPSPPRHKPSGDFINQESKHTAVNSAPTTFRQPSPPSTFGNAPKVHEQHQKNTATGVHSSVPEYQKQPASNPHYTPSGGYPKLPNSNTGSNGHNSHPNPPYPLNSPNHPHPQSNPFPNTHSSAPIGQTHHTNVASAPSYPQPPHGVSYPSGSYHPPSGHPGAGSYHPPSSYPGAGSYHPPSSYPGAGSYHPPSSYPGAGYHPGGSHYAPPPQQHYAPTYHAPPPTQAFVPGRTVYVEKPSKGPGLGTYIASGVAGGVAAGATNAIVDHAISSIFRPSSNHVHTYPSAPSVGTPTSTHTVNNYYYGNPGPGDSSPSSGSSNNNGPSSSNNSNNNGPSNSEPNYNNNNNGPSNNYDPNNGGNGGNQPSNQASSGGVSNVANDNKGNPVSTTNGIVSRTPEAIAQAEKDDPISDTNIMKLTEELFDAQDKNLYQDLEVNLQKRVTPSSNSNDKVPDEAPERLFKLKPELDSVPTIKALRELYDNYERDGTKPENITPEKEREEEAFIDEIMKTSIMTKAMDWLSAQKYIEPKESEKKDTLKRMWFSTFDNTSSGFERLFLSERFGNDGIVGMQNWLYFAHLESQDKVNYLGYTDNLSLSGKGQLLKLNYETDGFTIQNATIFAGTPPELEVALYTLCFYARPNNWCPVSLGGAKFYILTHLFRYYQKDLIDLGFPAIPSN